MEETLPNLGCQFEIVSQKLATRTIAFSPFTATWMRRRLNRRRNSFLADGNPVENLNIQHQHPTSTIQSSNGDRDKKQAVVVIGFPGTTMHDEDRYALEMIQESCSDLGSRLFLRIREQLGLAYYVGAQTFRRTGAGYFAFYAGTSRRRPRRSNRKFSRKPDSCALKPDREELKRAKANSSARRNRTADWSSGLHDHAR